MTDNFVLEYDARFTLAWDELLMLHETQGHVSDLDMADIAGRWTTSNLVNVADVADYIRLMEDLFSLLTTHEGSETNE